MPAEYAWSGMTPHDIAQLLASFDRPWWIAGGWAIDLALGRETRAHADMDIALLRGDEVPLHRLLPEWEFYAVNDGAFELWDAASPLEPPMHQFWVRRDAAGPWDFEILLEDHHDGRWRFRRDAAITLPVDRFGTRTAEGIPHVALEIALLYKAKGHHIERNAADFETALPVLDAAPRAWLADAVASADTEHPWLARLR